MLLLFVFLNIVCGLACSSDQYPRRRQITIMNDNQNLIKGQDSGSKVIIEVQILL